MKQTCRALVTRLVRAYRKDSVRFSLRVAVILLAVALLVVKRSIWTPDTLLIIMIIIGVAVGKARAFVIRFLPFLGMLVVYDSFRGIADDLNHNVHYLEMIDFDRWLFGGALPTVELQQWWYNGSLHWYDFYFYFLYTIHFLIPVMVALLLWKRADKYYWPFVVALVGMSFAAFIVYIAFPAAPPWMAKEAGLIAEPFTRISSHIWAAMGVENFSVFYAKISPNAVAAVPSLHSAYPLLAVLFVWKIASFRRFWWLMFYPISMWVGVVYMGEHYVFDALAGALFAVAAFFGSIAFFNWYRHPQRTLRHTVRRHLKRLRLTE